MKLRRGRPRDLPFLLELEKRFVELGFVGGDTKEVHEERTGNADCLYLIVENEGRDAGFVILRGLASGNRSIEIKRIVVAEPGRGVGREALRQVIRMAFGELSAHRLWLDVFEDNERARRTYRALGFIEEGTMRECVWNQNRFRSLVLMSMLENEAGDTEAAPPA